MQLRLLCSCQTLRCTFLKDLESLLRIRKLCATRILSTSSPSPSSLHDAIASFLCFHNGLVLTSTLTVLQSIPEFLMVPCEI